MPGIDAVRTLRTVGRGNPLARAALAGSVGGAAQRLAEEAVGEGIERAAQATGRRLAAKRAQDPLKKPLVGPAFWGIASAALVKDLLDILVNFTVLLSIVVIFTGLAITFIIVMYLHASGVEADAAKLVTAVLAIAIEMIPFLSILPATLAGLFFVRWQEHKKYEKKLANQKVSLAKEAATGPRAGPSPFLSQEAVMGPR